jgi:phenylacetate-CoA ligase
MTESRANRPMTYRAGIGSTRLGAWPATISNAAAFLRHPRGTRSHITHFQDRRLRQLVSHAYERVPYYRRLFDSAGVHPRHIRGTADLERIPITRKSDIRTLPASDLVARGVDPDKLIAHSTGGSTGEPFTIRRSWIEERTLGLIRRRALQYYGADSRALVVVATFHHRPHRNENRAIELMLNALGEYRIRSVYCLEPPESLVRTLEELQPDVIGGYAGVLDRLAAFITASGTKLKPPICVLSGAEVLDPLVAERVSKAFGAPVYDTYGAHEFSRIAWQCRDTGEYHRADDSAITEIMSDGALAAPGEEGEIVGTALHSYAMPFIRYQLGDIVTAGTDTCPCGQPFSTLRRIRGRVVDFFTLPDGRSLHPYEIAAAFKSEALRWVGQYQLVQETLNRIVFTVVPVFAPAPEAIASVKSAVQRVIGPDVTFDINLVDRLDLGPNGKFRIYRSLVQRD